MLCSEPSNNIVCFVEDKRLIGEKARANQYVYLLQLLKEKRSNGVDNMTNS